MCLEKMLKPNQIFFVKTTYIKTFYHVFLTSFIANYELIYVNLISITQIGYTTFHCLLSFNFFLCFLLFKQFVCLGTPC